MFINMQFLLKERGKERKGKEGGKAGVMREQTSKSHWSKKGEIWIVMGKIWQRLLRRWL